MGLKGRKSPTSSALSQMIRAKPLIPHGADQLGLRGSTRPARINSACADQLGLRGSTPSALINSARMGLKGQKSPTLSALSQMIRARPLKRRRERDQGRES